MRRLFALVAMVTTATLMLPVGAHAQEGGLVADPAKETEFVNKINDYRAGLGLAKLQVHSQLAAKARDWSRQMASEGRIWHSDLTRDITEHWKRLGENVGMGGSVQALHEAFIDSPSHNENLIDPGFRHIGLGVTVDAEGTIFVSEVFMELASQPAPAASSPAAGTPNSPDAKAAQPISSVKPGPASGAERPRSVSDGTKAAGAQVAPSPRLVSVLDRLRALDG